MFTKLLTGFLIGFVLSACGGRGPRSNLPTQNSTSYLVKEQYRSNGEKIYFTSFDQNGKQISYTGGPDFGGMMMSVHLSCSFCHGADAHGGTQVMAMQYINAPAINYAALNEMMAKETKTTLTPNGYSLDYFRTAVIQGKHPDGDTLNEIMPRWQMSDQDLEDLFDYLKTLP